MKQCQKKWSILLEPGNESLPHRMQIWFIFYLIASRPSVSVLFCINLSSWAWTVTLFFRLAQPSPYLCTRCTINALNCCCRLNRIWLLLRLLRVMTAFTKRAHFSLTLRTIILNELRWHNHPYKMNDSANRILERKEHLIASNV